MTTSGCHKLLEFRSSAANLRMTSRSLGGRIHNTYNPDQRCLPWTCLFGKGCTCRLAVVHLRVPRLHLCTVVCMAGQSLPMYKLPLSFTKLRSVVHFRVCSLQLRANPLKVSRNLRTCTFCTINAVDDERHWIFKRPHCGDLRQQHAELSQDFHDAMRCTIRHKDLQSVLLCRPPARCPTGPDIMTGPTS